MCNDESGLVELPDMNAKELNSSLKKFYSHYNSTHANIKRRDGENFKKVVFLKILDDLEQIISFDESLHVISSQLDVQDMRLVLFQNIDVRDLSLQNVKGLYKDVKKDDFVDLQFLRSSGPYYYDFIEVKVRLPNYF